MEKQGPPRIRAWQIWNSFALIQQFVFLAIIAFVYLVIRLLLKHSAGQYHGLQRWLDSLHALFYLSKPLVPLLKAVLIAILSSFSILGLDALVGFLKKEEISIWLHRGAFLLPENKAQSFWAFTVSFTGSTAEELLFRGFIFNAMLPIWNHWIWASLIISAVFATLHAGLQGFWSSFWIFLISILLCFLFVQGYSIYELSLIHITINLVNLFLIPRIFEKAGSKIP